MKKVVSLSTIIMCIICIILCCMTIFIHASATHADTPTTQHYSTAKNRIASYSTNFQTSAENRVHNITLAASKLDALVIPSGESFSFNKIVGKRTAENGFKNALIIFEGKYVEGIGGGVCQVSSTLYNAWIRAGLQSLEAKTHSLPTSYCQLAQDATVSDWIDLVLLNNSEQSVEISCKIIDKVLTIDIYGKKPQYDIQLVSKIIETISPPPPFVQYTDAFDPNATIYTTPYGRYVILSNEKCGYIAECYIQYYLNGKIVEQHLLRKAYYIPVRGVILIEKTMSEQGSQ